MEKWISSWGFIPIDFRFMPFTLENETQRIYLRNNVRGNRVRLRFSNRGGVTPMHLEQVTIGIGWERDGGWSTENITEVTFGGKSGVTLAPGEERYSDGISFPAQPGQWLAVSTYLRERQQLNPSCTTNNRTMTQVEDVTGGNWCMEVSVAEKGISREPKVPGDIRDMMMYGLRQVDVYTADPVKTVVVFGDSITHIGHWSGWMTKRLYEKYPGKISVINRGMGGNRLIGGEDDPNVMQHKFGSAGCKRFERDVFEQKELSGLWEKAGGQASFLDNPVDMVVVMEGVNDINHAEDPFVQKDSEVSSNALAEGLRRCIRICHEHGTPIYLATLTPVYNFKGIWTEAGEGLRQAYNHWIRFQKEAEGFFDFDRSIRDEANPIAMVPEYDVGDHLHPSFAGGQKIAQDMDLEEFWGKMKR